MRPSLFACIVWRSAVDAVALPKAKSGEADGPAEEGHTHFAEGSEGVPGEEVEEQRGGEESAVAAQLLEGTLGSSAHHDE